jgi:hypothetical protein
VTDAIAPGYSKVITRPMDFSTMRARAQRGEYASLDEIEARASFPSPRFAYLFAILSYGEANRISTPQADLELIVSNCCKFNPVTTPYHKAALQLRRAAASVLGHERDRLGDSLCVRCAVWLFLLVLFRRQPGSLRCVDVVLCRRAPACFGTAAIRPLPGCVFCMRSDSSHVSTLPFLCLLVARARQATRDAGAWPRPVQDRR